MIEILPSILARDGNDLHKIMKKYEDLSGPFHVDISDGIFVEGSTVGLEEIEVALKNKPFDLHLMVQKPEEILPMWLSLPNLRRIVFHVEATPDPVSVMNMIRGMGREALVAINPETDINVLDQYTRDMDGVHFMTVHPGAYAGEHLKTVIDKIREFSSRYTEIPIQDDGGVSPENINELSQAGVTRFVVGSYLLNSDDVGKAIEELRSKV